MSRKWIHAKPALLFLASAVCVSAAAEELNFDKAQWTVEDIASQSLETSADRLLADLAASATHQVEISSDGRIPYVALVGASDDCPLKASVKAKAPTLFLRYLGVETRPIELTIEMTPTVSSIGS